MEKAELVQVHFTLGSRDQHSKWMQDGCKVYMDSYMASNISCCMVMWTISIKPPLGGRPNTKNRETTTLWMLTTVDLFYSTMHEDPHKQKFIEIAFGWGPGHIRLHTTLEDLWPHYMSFEVGWDGLWTLSFGLSPLHGHGSWLMCEVSLSVVIVVAIKRLGWTNSYIGSLETRV